MLSWNILGAIGSDSSSEVTKAMLSFCTVSLLQPDEIIIFRALSMIPFAIIPVHGLSTMGSWCFWPYRDFLVQDRNFSQLGPYLLMFLMWHITFIIAPLIRKSAIDFIQNQKICTNLYAITKCKFFLNNILCFPIISFIYNCRINIPTAIYMKSSGESSS